jgi:hypothetical protein
MVVIEAVIVVGLSIIVVCFPDEEEINGAMFLTDGARI